VPTGERPRRIEWEAETPLGTAVRFQMRSAPTDKALSNAPWIGPDGENTWYTQNGTAVKGITGNWIQYRARLITPNGGATPYLSRVTIDFE
jgi:hypothetical protein